VVRAPTVQAAPATVHVLAVGIGDYDYRRLATGRPAQGAERLAAVFEQLHQQDRPVLVHRLIGPVKVKAIRAKFGELAKGMAAGDSFVLYLAGRGWTMKGGHYWLPSNSPSDRYRHIEEYGLDQDGLLALLAEIPATRGLLFLESYRARPPYLRAVKGVLTERAVWERLRRTSGRPLLAVNADFELGDDQGPGALAAALAETLEGLAGDLEGVSLAAACEEQLRTRKDDGLRIHLPTGAGGR